MGSPIRKGNRPHPTISKEIQIAVQEDRDKQHQLSSHIPEEPRLLSNEARAFTHNVLWNSSTQKSTVQKNLQKKIESGATDMLIHSFVDVLAASNPLIGAAYLLYQVIQFVYPIVKVGIVTYLRTSDENDALRAMVEELIVQSTKQVIGSTVNALAHITVDKTKEIIKFTGNKTMDKFAEAVISETVGVFVDNTFYYPG